MQTWDKMKVITLFAECIPAPEKVEDDESDIDERLTDGGDEGSLPFKNKNYD